MGQSANSISSLSVRLFRQINKQNIVNFHRDKEERNISEIKGNSMEISFFSSDDVYFYTANLVKCMSCKIT